jgi:hypothetical protein
MQRQTQFGRRPQRDEHPLAMQSVVAAPVTVAEVGAAAPATDADIDREIAEWNRQRKARRRSFREPWRSFSIAAALAFGASEWLLPDSVARVADAVSMGLFAASLFAGFRKR